MSFRGKEVRILLLLALLNCVPGGWLTAGIRKDLQEGYVSQYENRALYLKVPIHGTRQVLFVRESPQLDRSTMGQPLTFKVGEQVRILDLEFKNQLIRFKIAAIDFSRQAELVFQFDQPLVNEFPQKGRFDSALEFTFTAGLNYQEIDAAKEEFIARQFDSLITQFARTTGTTEDFVIRKISEQNPEFRRNQQTLAQREAELASLRTKLDQESKQRASAEREIRQLTNQLQEAETDSDSLKEERQALDGERERLRLKAEKLEEELKSVELRKSESDKQIQDLIAKLNEESSAQQELGNRVESLATLVEAVKADKAKAESELSTLKDEHKRQAEVLQDVEAQRNRLASDLKALTSDKNSLSSRFHETRQQNQALATVLQLNQRLKVRRTRADDGFAGEIFLASHKLGQVRVEQPELGQAFQLKVSLDSPDTVKFSEEERELFSALGKQLVVEPRWSSEDESFQVKSLEDSTRKTITPRESAEWNFRLEGEPSSAMLHFQLVAFDTGDQPVEIDRFSLTVGDGWKSWLAAEFSWLSLALGLLLGVLCAALFFSRRKPKPQPAPLPKNVVVAKKLS